MTKRAKESPASPEIVKVLTCPRPRSQPARMWSAIRVLGRFDLPQLQIAAEVSADAAQRYLSLLERTGYVQSRADRGEIAYALVHRSGPRAPILRESRGGEEPYRALIDPNDGTVHQLQPRRPHGSGRAGSRSAPASEPISCARGVNHGR